MYSKVKEMEGFVGDVQVTPFIGHIEGTYLWAIHTIR